MTVRPRKRGRPKESRYKSLGLILTELAEKPRSFREIIDRTNLHRSTVGKCLRSLMENGLVKKERHRRKVIYFPIEEEDADTSCWAFFFLNYATDEARNEVRKVFEQDAYDEARITLHWLDMAEKYQKEIEELEQLSPEITRETYPIDKIFRSAKERRWILSEKKRASLRLSSDNYERRIVPSRIEHLYAFKKDYPEVIEEYRRIVREYRYKHSLK